MIKEKARHEMKLIETTAYRYLVICTIGVSLGINILTMGVFLFNLETLYRSSSLWLPVFMDKGMLILVLVVVTVTLLSPFLSKLEEGFREELEMVWSDEEQ